jgi:hypothetical protein
MKNNLRDTLEGYEAQRQDTAQATFKYTFEGVTGVTFALLKPGYSWSFLTADTGDLQFRTVYLYEREVTVERKDPSGGVTVRPDGDPPKEYQRWEVEFCPQVTNICILYSGMKTLDPNRKWHQVGKAKKVKLEDEEESLALSNERDGQEHDNGSRNHFNDGYKYLPMSQLNQFRRHGGNTSFSSLVIVNGTKMRCYPPTTSDPSGLSTTMNCYPATGAAGTAPSLIQGDPHPRGEAEKGDDLNRSVSDHQMQKMVKKGFGNADTKMALGGAAVMSNKIWNDKKYMRRSRSYAEGDHTFKIQIRFMCRTPRDYPPP